MDTLTAPTPAVVAPARDERAPRWSGVFCWLVPTLLTGLIVGYRATAPEPWRDELATWSAASRSVSQIFGMGQHIDGVSVPYYLLVHVSIRMFGDSALALRLPSLLAMTATVAVAALLARRLWGTLPALLTGLLLAVVPSVSRYAQEARGYAVTALVATLTTLLLVKAVERPGWWRFTAYGAGLTLTGLSHLIALLILAGHLVIVFPRSLARWTVAGAAALAVLTPLARLGLEQRGKQLDWLTQSRPTALGNLPGALFLSAVIGGAVCALAVTALRDRWSARLGLTVVLPILALYAIDQLVTPMFMPRYVFFVVPLLAVLAGRGLSALNPYAGVATVLVLGLIGLPQQGELRRSHTTTGYREAAAVLRTNARPGDAVVYADRAGWQFTDVAMHYYNGDRLPRDLLLTASATSNNSLWPTECPAPATCLAPADRIWLLGPTDRLTPATRSALLGSFDRTRQFRVPGLSVALYLPRNSP